MNQVRNPRPTIDQLQLHTTVEAPRVASLTRTEVVELAKTRLNRPFVPIFSTYMQLSARQPYDAVNGNVDVYMPGRWDTSSDLIFMDAIVQGAQVGEWTGSAAYVRFNAQTSGNHLIAVNFTGADITMRLNGPWGTATANATSVSTSFVVLAEWSVTAGEPLFFTIDCVNASNLPDLGYIKSIQAFN